MNINYNLALVLLLAAVVNSQILTPVQTRLDNTNGNILVNTSRQCGGEILDTEAGSIEYKLAEPLGPNERCVWIIRVKNATGYSVGIFSLGIPEPNLNHKLQLTSFEGESGPETLTVDHLGMYELKSANAIIVTFVTGSASNISDNTGFLLEYSSHFDGNSSLVYQYEEFMVPTYQYNQRLNFGSTEVAMGFKVFNWGNDTYNPAHTMKLALVSEEQWTTSHRIEAYVHRRESSWQFREVLSSRSESIIIESADPVLLVRRIRSASTISPVYRLISFNCNGGEFIHEGMV